MGCDFKAKVVVITGASAGVGRATARRFGRDGAWVGLIARGKDGLEGARREIEDAGGRAVTCVADVGDHAQVEGAAEQIERELGPIEVWVNNAMTSVFSPFKEMTPEEFRRVTEVTYLGYVWGTMAALKRMQPRDCGVIVQVGSALAYRSIPLQSAYCGAKHAIKGFTDSLRSELIHDGSKVRVSMVQMPALNTPQFGWVKSRLRCKAQPVPPIFQPEVAAEAVHWISRHARRELFVGYSTVKAILANRAIPGWLDRYLARTAYSGQQSAEPRDPQRPDNLWQPVPGDHGAHGEFDEKASSGSPQLWAAKNRRVLGTLALGCGAAAAGLWLGGYLTAPLNRNGAANGE